MSDDKELLARLRDFKKVTVWDVRDAADRIEQLVATNEALTKERDSLLAGHRVLNIGGARLQDRAETAEAKLAKAVKSAFEEGFLVAAADGWVNNPRIEMEWKRSKALAELKGKSHD